MLLIHKRPKLGLSQYNGSTNVLYFNAFSWCSHLSLSLMFVSQPLPSSDETPCFVLTSWTLSSLTLTQDLGLEVSDSQFSLEMYSPIHRLLHDTHTLSSLISQIKARQHVDKDA